MLSPLCLFADHRYLLIAILVWLALNLASSFCAFLEKKKEEKMLTGKFLFLIYHVTEPMISAGDTCTPILQHPESFLSGSCWRLSTRKQEHEALGKELSVFMSP